MASCATVLVRGVGRAARRTGIGGAGGVGLGGVPLRSAKFGDGFGECGQESNIHPNQLKFPSARGGHFVTTWAAQGTGAGELPLSGDASPVACRAWCQAGGFPRIRAQACPRSFRRVRMRWLSISCHPG
jgi:hypothetical protein